MYKEIIKKIEPELEKVMNFFEGEMMKIRTSRATPSLIEDVIVNCFGQNLPIKQLGAISCPEPRKIVIQPWDKSYLEPIATALSKSNIGIAPIVEKDIIRLSMPPMSEEYRKSLSRLLADRAEETRRTVRHWRDEAWKEVQQKAREGEIREDDKFRAKDDLQEIVDKYSERIEKMVEQKRKEIAE